MNVYKIKLFIFLKKLNDYILPTPEEDHPDAVIIHVGINDRIY